MLMLMAVFMVMLVLFELLKATVVLMVQLCVLGRGFFCLFPLGHLLVSQGKVLFGNIEAQNQVG